MHPWPLHTERPIQLLIEDSCHCRHRQFRAIDFTALDARRVCPAIAQRPGFWVTEVRLVQIPPPQCNQLLSPSARPPETQEKSAIPGMDHLAVSRDGSDETGKLFHRHAPVYY